MDHEFDHATAERCMLCRAAGYVAAAVAVGLLTWLLLKWLPVWLAVILFLVLFGLGLAIVGRFCGDPATAGRLAAAERNGLAPVVPPPTTALGALVAHITGGADQTTFQPMNVNFGLFPPMEGIPEGGRKTRKLRKPALAERALADLAPWNRAMSVTPTDAPAAAQTAANAAE